MARTQSLAMTRALKAITNPNPDKRLPPPEAAKKFGVKVNSIYRRPVYKAWAASQKEAPCAAS